MKSLLIVSAKPVSYITKTNEFILFNMQKKLKMQIKLTMYLSSKNFLQYMSFETVFIAKTV